MKKTSKMLIAAALLGAGTVMAYAAAADDAIKARQACMKSNGAFMGVAVPMVKGEKSYDKAALDTAIATIEAACGSWATSFPDDSMKSATTETWAKEEAWTKKADFQAAGEKYYNALQAVKAAPDEAGFKATFGGLGESCKGCHDGFRRPKEG